ncbi:hypothetical protein K9N68_22505 [Kovacikia minuta CCNUW1]|uniref:hypothetical protein n=1 Tax=Kovacikia minuta TaxID=2931930 RepID=UPI001CCD5665|nr:hypothetical protein [Kovacikia minuta]UBF24448.1 hypothetical protein K9N68_22505 [Kovacikia minuta CCNUW1]
MDIQSLITTPVQNWIAAHPVVAWIVEHPIWTIGLIVLGIFLFWGLLKAIASLSEKIWLALLAAPLKLGRWLFQLGFSLFRISSSTPTADPPPQTDNQTQLIALLNKLEALKQEQDEIVKEIKAILAIEN